jgi:acyl carrier protein
MSRDKCRVCGNAEVVKRVEGSIGLCHVCAKLLHWFRSHFFDSSGAKEASWISPETTFRELSIESLDYVEWIIEAEKQFAIKIPDNDATRLKSVGDYLGYIKLRCDGKSDRRDPLGSNTLWDREIDG